MPAATPGMIDPDGPWRPRTSQRNANLSSHYYASHPAPERVSLPLLRHLATAVLMLCLSLVNAREHCMRVYISRSALKNLSAACLFESVLLCSRIQPVYCRGLCMHLPATMRSLWTGKLLPIRQPMPERAIYTGRMLGTIRTTQRYASLCCSIWHGMMHAIPCTCRVKP